MNGFQVVFEIGSPDKIRILHSEDPWEGRGAKCVELLGRISGELPPELLGRTTAVSFADFPPPAEWADRFDFSFCTTKRLGVGAPCLPFPCPYLLRWPEVGIPDAEALMESMLSDRSAIEDERVFWIGADTHKTRQHLCAIGRNHPKWFDFELMEWDRSAAEGQRSRTRQVSLPEHRRYKYLLDIRGVGHSVRLKWLLASGRPVFLVEREIVDHWFEEMQPWVHYIPVAADLSDLMERHRMLEGDPALYEEIGRNAREFAARRLRVRPDLDATLEAAAGFVAEDRKWIRRRSGVGPRKKAVMVVARTDEDPGWIDSVPDWIQVFIINKGAPVPEDATRSSDPAIERRWPAGGEAESHLAFMERGGHRGFDWVIFTSGNPFRRSPEFLNLLTSPDPWDDFQPLIRPTGQEQPEGQDSSDRSKAGSGGSSGKKWPPTSAPAPTTDGIHPATLLFAQLDAPHPSVRESKTSTLLGVGTPFAVRSTLIDRLPFRNLAIARQKVTEHWTRTQWLDSISRSLIVRVPSVHPKTSQPGNEPPVRLPRQ